METIKNISIGIMYGLWDSIRGMSLLFHIDDEIHRLNAEKEEERRQKILERQRRRRSPSPTPSSASAMERMYRESLTPVKRENPDERSIESLRKKPQATEEPSRPKGEKKIAKQVLKCCVLNGGFTWLSVVLFEQVLLPTLKFILTLCYGSKSQDLNLIWGWLQSVLSIIFGCMWVMPIFVLSKIVSSLWFADIANAAYRVRKGRPQMIPGISKLIADFLFSLVVQALFLVQSMLVNMVPVRHVGAFLSFVHLCLLYSLYSFEYKWFNMGWELHRRLSYLENNWPYFLGFGAPLTLLTNMTNSFIVSSCIFSIFFPLFILSGNEAKIIVGTTDTPLRLFRPVIFVSNLLFSSRSTRLNAARIAQQKQQQQIEQQKLRQQQPQLYEHQQSRHELRRRSSEFREHSEEPQYRYQQPPPLQPHLIQQQQQLRSRHKSMTPSPVRRSTPEGGRYVGGMRLLIPTKVPGAPAGPPSTSTVSTGSGGSSSSSAYHR